MKMHAHAMVPNAQESVSCMESVDKGSTESAMASESALRSSSRPRQKERSENLAGIELHRARQELARELVDGQVLLLGVVLIAEVYCFKP